MSEKAQLPSFRESEKYNGRRALLLFIALLLTACAGGPDSLVDGGMVSAAPTSYVDGGVLGGEEDQTVEIRDYARVRILVGESPINALENRVDGYWKYGEYGAIVTGSSGDQIAFLGRGNLGLEVMFDLYVQSPDSLPGQLVNIMDSIAGGFVEIGEERGIRRLASSNGSAWEITTSTELLPSGSGYSEIVTISGVGPGDSWFGARGERQDVGYGPVDWNSVVYEVRGASD